MEKAVISNKGLVALVFTGNQRFIISATPLEDNSGFSIGIENLRIGVAHTEPEARALVRKTVAFFTTTILEVE